MLHDELGAVAVRGILHHSRLGEHGELQARLTQGLQGRSERVGEKFREVVGSAAPVEYALSPVPEHAEDGPFPGIRHCIEGIRDGEPHARAEHVSRDLGKVPQLLRKSVEKLSEDGAGHVAARIAVRHGENIDFVQVIFIFDDLPCAGDKRPSEPGAVQVLDCGSGVRPHDNGS
jgi:hypothetical protein